MTSNTVSWHSYHALDKTMQAFAQAERFIELGAGLNAAPPSLIMRFLTVALEFSAIIAEWGVPHGCFAKLA
jgi:hypothetical protein